MEGAENVTFTCLSLGSNLGDRKSNLKRATRLLEERAGSIVRISGVYESASWGYTSLHPYYNCCLEIRTGIQPLNLMELALGIELEMGRKRNPGRYDDRIIDIDILFYGDLVLEHPQLILPHPRLSERGFVLVPLAEILPELVHPLSGKTVGELLENCPDAEGIRAV